MACLQALVLADANGIKENCLKLGAGEDLYALFAGILTMRPWNRVIDPAVDHLAIQGNASDPAVDHLLHFKVFGVSRILTPIGHVVQFK